MNHQRFQSAAIIVLTFAVTGLAALIWLQNIAIGQIGRAVETLATSASRPAPFTAEQAPSAAASRGFMDVFKEFSASAATLTPAANEKAPAGTVELAMVRVDNCPPKPDGVCGYSLFVYGPSSWETPGEQQFYLAETAGGPLSFFGPYTGDLGRIVSEAKMIKTLTEPK